MCVCIIFGLLKARFIYFNLCRFTLSGGNGSPMSVFLVELTENINQISFYHFETLCV